LRKAERETSGRKKRTRKERAPSRTRPKNKKNDDIGTEKKGTAVQHFMNMGTEEGEWQEIYHKKEQGERRTTEKDIVKRKKCQRQISYGLQKARLRKKFRYYKIIKRPFRNSPSKLRIGGGWGGGGGVYIPSIRRK